MPAKLQTVHALHFDIQKDKVRLALFCHFKSRICTCRPKHPEALVSQYSACKGYMLRHIVNNKYLRFFKHSITALPKKYYSVMSLCTSSLSASFVSLA